MDVIKKVIKKARRGGFSLIELMVVVGIVALLVTVMVTPLAPFRNKQALQGGVEMVISLLHDARTRTLASTGNSQYGIHFETDRLVLFQGQSYPGTNPEEFPLDPLLSISNIALTGGGPNVIFKRLSGKTDESGKVSVSLRADATQNQSITIHRTGLVSIE